MLAPAWGGEVGPSVALDAYSSRLGRSRVEGPDACGEAVTEWLADKSALVRLAQGPDAALWAERVARGLVRITTVTRLEVGYSARHTGQPTERLRP